MGNKNLQLWQIMPLLRKKIEGERGGLILINCVDIISRLRMINY
jgi:hypothetical protein